MDDEEIIALYWDRNEKAITETAEKYGAYCLKISRNILSNLSDSEENVNDTYLKTWNNIPPTRPEIFSAFLGKIARNLAINKYKSRHAQKRSGDEFTLSLEELEMCTPSGMSVEDELHSKELSKAINAFLHEQKEDVRKIFVRRYFYCDSTRTISENFGFGESKVKSVLMRTRMKLRRHLEKEGFYE